MRCSLLCDLCKLTVIHHFIASDQLALLDKRLEQPTDKDKQRSLTHNAVVLNYESGSQQYAFQQT